MSNEALTDKDIRKKRSARVLFVISSIIYLVAAILFSYVLIQFSLSEDAGRVGMALVLAIMIVGGGISFGVSFLLDIIALILVSAKSVRSRFTIAVLVLAILIPLTAAAFAVGIRFA